jgi:hypothetical protein
MNWIFPIAGFGTRTAKLGEYKPLIDIFPGDSILKLCLSGLITLFDPEDRFVFIASRFQESEYFVTQNVKRILYELDLKNQVDVVLLNETPAGQALTIKNGIERLDSNLLQDRTVVINSDQVVFFDFGRIDMDRCSVGLYFNDTPSSCFFDLDIQRKRIKKIEEKNKISCYASSGVFYFTSARELLDCISWGIDAKEDHDGELYLGPCMKYFDDLSYFQTLFKFDLGNIESINLFRNFSEKIIKGGDKK